MSILLSLKSAADSLLGTSFRAAIRSDMTIIENEANRVAAIVKPTSIVLGAVERNTWPAAGSATVALTDVFANGQIGNLPAGNPDAGINTNAGVMLHRFKANGAIEVTADPVLNMDVATKQWVEARVGDYSLDTGTANAKVLALNPVITAYSVNFVGTFKNAVLNTGPCTINFGGGIVPLVSGTGAALGGGDLPAGIVAEYQYIVTDNKAYITTLRLPPSGAAAAAIASAATVDLTSVQNGGIVHISGTVATSALTMFAGQTVTLIADAAWPLTYNATTMKLTGGINYTCAIGDELYVTKDNGGVIQVTIVKASGAPVNMSAITNSLAADVLLNNIALYFDGPSVAQGTVGTWFVSGTVTVTDPGFSAAIYTKLWDGTTVIDSGATQTVAAGGSIAITLSGIITNPAANLKISVRDLAGSSAFIKFNVTGNSKDSTITAIRIG
jgi:hypothetical protein